ncbi:hypothetical protein J3Q64DRAFT_1758657 [Phycomyces blakesleeanus]|uniref:CBS domain-containing protein n=1 Tax=Phycomyces blakesleeanus TaxID=4837 RepID=A0ABR3ATC2_PHYBL
MAAKRSDCVLVVDDDEHLSGIFTAKDLAYRVVADNLDTRSTTVADIMTNGPMCVTADTSAQDALNLMVSRGFRHLPVCNEEGDIFGLLDITKCLYEALNKMERAFGSSRKLYDALEGVEREWAHSPAQFVQYMETLREKMACPDLTTVLDHAGPVQVPVKAQVREVARLMKEHHTTAVLVMDHGGLAGIFTSKDIVLRVIAAGLAPDACSVVRVMTPHPDTAYPSTSILEGLKKMHDGHYLNLPVLDYDKNIVGIVDVLRLTYAILEQINSIEGNVGDNSKFWQSIATGDHPDTESAISDSLSQAANSHMFQSPSPDSMTMMNPMQLPGHTQTFTSLGLGRGYSEISPADSASVVDDNQDIQDIQSSSSSNPMINGNSSETFSFKFTYGSRAHRFRCDPSQFSSFREMVRQKIIAEHLSLSQSYVDVGGPRDSATTMNPNPNPNDNDNVDVDVDNDWLSIAYLDDEEDQVLMTCDNDLTDAVQLARKMGHDRVRLFVHDSLAEQHPNHNHDESSIAGTTAVSSASVVAGLDIPAPTPVSQPTLSTLSDPNMNMSTMSISSANNKSTVAPGSDPAPESTQRQLKSKPKKAKPRQIINNSKSKKRRPTRVSRQDESSDSDEDSSGSDMERTGRTLREPNFVIPQEMLLPAAITFLGVVILGVFAIAKLTGGSNSRY